MSEYNPTLPGNPYIDAGYIQAITETNEVRDALLAIAYELRTANLIAGGDTRDEELRKRLGLPAKPPGRVGGVR